jgi:hypothetical protein
MYRFENRMLFVIVPLYVLVVILGISLSHFHLHPTRIWAVLCAALLSSPGIGFIFCFGLYLSEEKDEFQRTLLVQSILWALGVTICVGFFWFALGTFFHVPQMKFASDEILFAVVYAVSSLVTRWRYR